MSMMEMYINLKISFSTKFRKIVQQKKFRVVLSGIPQKNSAFRIPRFRDGLIIKLSLFIKKSNRLSIESNFMWGSIFFQGSYFGFKYFIWVNFFSAVKFYLYQGSNSFIGIKLFSGVKFHLNQGSNFRGQN